MNLAVLINAGAYKGNKARELHDAIGRADPDTTHNLQEQHAEAVHVGFDGEDARRQVLGSNVATVHTFFVCLSGEVLQ